VREQRRRQRSRSRGLAALTLLLVAGLAALYALAPRVETLPMDDRARAEAGGASVALSDGVVHYQRAGPEGASAVVLVHGFSTPYLIWDANFSALSEAGYQAVRYDLYGRGFSDRPRTAVYGPDLFDRQLLELIRELQLPTPLTLGGVSMGGAISVLFAERHPELVNGLILVDPAGFPMPMPLAIQLLRVPGLGEYLMRVLGDRSIRAGMGSNFSDASLLPEFSRKFEVQLRYEGFQHGQLATLRQMPLQALEPSYRAVGASGLPVLLIWGTEDRVIPFETSQRVRAAIPQAELLAVERAAHTPNYERPELVNPAMLAFLGRLHAPR
jgi:pimeloyl-ACP methyl ester carboxylesterase